jgi:hypothetical protein
MCTFTVYHRSDHYKGGGRVDRVAHIREVRNVYIILAGKADGVRCELLGRH